MENENLKKELFNLFLDAHSEVKEIVSKKYEDYGPKTLISFKGLGIFIKANTKMSRLENFYEEFLDGNFEFKVTDETVEDTWKDLAAFSIWAIAVKRYLDKEAGKE